MDHVCAGREYPLTGGLVTLIALATLAFGAVYEWAFVPLFAICALLGLLSMRRGVPRRLRPLAYGFLVLGLAISLQLVPLPRTVLTTVSPNAASLLTNYSLLFAAGAQTVPISIDPRATRTALAALAAFGFYLIGVSSALGAGHVRRFPRALALFAVPLALFGILSRALFESSNRIYGFWKPEQGGGDQFGPFVNRNHFAGWMLMATCVLIGALLGQVERAVREQRGTRQRRISWLSSAEANGIVLMGAAVLVTTISLFWTLSRSAMISFGVATAAFGLLAFRRRRLGTTGHRAAILAGLAVIVLVGVSWRGPARLITWFQFQNSQSVVGRVAAWQDGWQVVRAFPAAGTGLNTYSDAMLFYQRGNAGFHLAQAHNDYLQILAEGGLLVAIPAVLVLVLLVRGILRSLRDVRAEARGYWIRVGASVGLLAIGVQECFEFSLQMPANALLFCTLAAVALTPPAPVARDTINAAQG